MTLGIAGLRLSCFEYKGTEAPWGYLRGLAGFDMIIEQLISFSGQSLGVFVGRTSLGMEQPGAMSGQLSAAACLHPHGL